MATIQLFNPSLKPIEQCIDEAFASFGVPKLGGASSDGWSKISDFQRCPYRYWALHEKPKDELVTIGEKSVNLELGALYHAMLACHYQGSIEGPTPSYPTALELVHRVESFGGNKDICNEATRLYMAYWQHYGNPHDEGLKPLAVELGAGTEGIHTCRLDLLAERQGGIWIVEHKTASRETREVLEGWWLDGEIIGEVYGYKLSGLEKIYGPLVGVCVNVCIKTKEPKFRRIDVVVPDSLLARYVQDRGFWTVEREAMKIHALGVGGNAAFPRKLQGCIGRYDTCSLWDHCRDADATDSERLTRLLEASLTKDK